MRSRNTLAVTDLPDFIAWAENDGWTTQAPKSHYEAWRGNRDRVTAIIHRRDTTNNGAPLTHLTTWGVSEVLRRQWMVARRAMAARRNQGDA